MKYYLKNDSWHNQIRKQVVMRVDESIFSVLYTELTGAPNASIRVLIGMMLLKEVEQVNIICNFVQEKWIYLFQTFN